MNDKPFFHSAIINDDEDSISIITDEFEDKTFSETLPEELPILPLRNTALFPGILIPITIGREMSIKLVNDAYKGNKIIGVVAQKDTSIENPTKEDLHNIGTVAVIIKTLKMPDDNTTVIIQGKVRFEIQEMVKTEPYFIGKIKKLEEEKPEDKDKEFNAISDSLKETALQIIKSSPNIPPEASFAITNIETPNFLINFICTNNNIPISDKQKLLETSNLKNRALLALENLNKELQLLELKNKIQKKVRTDIDNQQKEYFLHQQIKTIQEELGNGGTELEIEELKKKAKNKKWSKEVSDKFEKEIQKLQRMNSASPEYSIQVNYLETLVEMPWNLFTKDNFDLSKAEKILERDHYGLDKVKERIIEYLAVLKLKGDMKSPILCFYGPPGVGKTSLGKSIAEALNRKHVRISLGGIRDEAEIRGHRKTYIGAMPGRIIKNIKKVNSSNPVFVLDEIDKLTYNIQGDPSSALLEVLDPEQNYSFHDNFLEVDFDLSKVMFIATANSLETIQPALRDRMEIIEINSYLLEEKILIAKKHLIPKQLKEHGLTKTDIIFDKEIIEKIVSEYTHEAGVRALEKVIAKIIRKIAKYKAFNQDYNKKLKAEDISTILGPQLITKDRYEGNDIPGVVTGLAWTQVGGDILFIEVSLSKGKGNFSITGNLGSVMKESATIALEYLKSNYKKFNIDYKIFENTNIHIHVPEGATPKDGPSAGITLLTALVSAITKRKVKKAIAMTGEITLRGKVLPVGGIKEKILAAKRANIKEIILSKSNKKDVDDINKLYVEGLKFSYVETMDEVISLAII